MIVSCIAREQNWAKDHFGNLKVVEHVSVSIGLIALFKL